MEVEEGQSFVQLIPKILLMYRLPIALGSVSLLCILVSIVLIVKSVQTNTPIVFHEETTASASGSAEQHISIDVAGAVHAPGVYALPLGSRVEDGITAAGGLSEDADTELIAQTLNRAATLKDGAKIYVSKKGEVKDVNNNASYNQIVQRDNVTSHNLQSDTLGLATTINVNTASSSQLDTLPGVGPVTAQKIISNRPYMSLDELVSKKAMGASLFGKLKDRLSL